VDKLLAGFNEGSYYAVGYQMILKYFQMGNFLQLSQVLQTALGTVQQWRNKTGLSINPNKMAVIPFARKKRKEVPQETNSFRPKKSNALD
jgi:DNA-binding transcriptional regulator of glucitol operon